MNEELLQYIWLAGLFDSEGLKTTDGKEVLILKRGKLNTDSGPDFSAARIRIGEADWVGNIEIHVHSDDWYLHKHHLDTAYNNTILHVVYSHHKQAVRQDGSAIPTLEINNRIYESILKNYKQLKNSKHWIPCAPFIAKIDHFTTTQALDRALINRFERKADQVKNWLTQANNDWHTVFYYAITRSFGFGTNSIPFEQLAFNLPITILGKHKNNLTQIEALVFGTAGFLEQSINDPYFDNLKSEWHFLQKKYKLKALQSSTFKMMRMRPGNFPTMRLAQLSKLIYQSYHLMSLIIELEDIKKIEALFELEASDYWQTHYVFGKETKKHSAELSQNAIDLLLINAVVPILFVYAQSIGDEKLSTKAISILQHLKPESNSIITHWNTFGINATNAFDSQALIELKTHYCDAKQCLNCKIGNKILQGKGE